MLLCREDEEDEKTTTYTNLLNVRIELEFLKFKQEVKHTKRASYIYVKSTEIHLGETAEKYIFLLFTTDYKIRLEYIYIVLIRRSHTILAHNPNNK